METAGDQNKFINFLKLYWLKIYSLLLAVYTLPDAFCLYAGNDLDSSWIRAINYAIKHKLVFGTDFVFTYGPLGFLSTRQTQYVPDLVLFATDIFMCWCFYHIIYKLLSANKSWWLILFAAIFYCKGCDYSELFFLFFLIFCILSLQSDRVNYFELTAAGICGTTVFFDKLNYGIISIPILLIVLIYLYFRHRKAFRVLLVASVLTFTVICAFVHINLFNYVRYGLPVVFNYPDGMVMDVAAVSRLYTWALVLIGIFISVLAFCFIRVWKEGKPGFPLFFSALALTLMCFLMYKNAFTMLHVSWFFHVFPLLLILTFLLLRCGRLWWSRPVCIAVLAIVYLQTSVPRGLEGRGFIRGAFIDPTVGYFSSLFIKEVFLPYPDWQIPDDKLQRIGRSTIDVMPVDVALLLLHDLNYDPRPVIQSYTTYSVLLDSLNADHFYRTGRPGYALVSSWSIEDKYAQWEESKTKCTLHLNYDVVDYFPLKNHKETGNPTTSFLLLQARPGVQRYPEFEKIGEREAGFDDTIHLNFPDDQAIYMTADVEYTPFGKIANLLYQPPILMASFWYDSACASGIIQRVIRPLLKEPELINKQVLGNEEYRNFLTGNLAKNRTIKAFSLHSTKNVCVRRFKLTFYRFKNY